MKLRGVLFDFDGTIFDTERFGQEAIKTTFENHFQTVVDEDELIAHSGMRYEDRFLQMLAMRGIDDDTLVDILTQNAEEYSTKNHTFASSLVPGVVEFIAALHNAGVRLAVVSASGRERLEQELQAVDLIRYFERITGHEDVTIQKPHPEPYLQTLERMGLGAHETVVFEDSPPGVEAAFLAGIPVVGLLTTFYEQDLLRATKTIRDYTEITIEELNALL